MVESVSNDPKTMPTVTTTSPITTSKVGPVAATNTEQLRLSSSNEEESNKLEMPAALRSILQQVARTGACPSLPWSSSGDTTEKKIAPFNGVRVNGIHKRKRDETNAIESDNAPPNGLSTLEHKTNGEAATPTPSDSKTAESSQYDYLDQAISTAIGFVLDHSFRHQGGYKLSPAELRKFTEGGDGTKLKINPAQIFQERRQRLMGVVLDHGIKSRDGPPFTIQRLAEVLVTPERYYTKTHKLCNCLEKLVLITSSVNAFGGSIGGETSQSRQEEREMAALADEQERLQSEQRNLWLRRRMSASTTDEAALLQQAAKLKQDGKEKTDLAKAAQLEAKASLRHKFDHAATPDAAHAAAADADARARSPPPPSLAKNSPAIQLASHSAVASFVRHLAETQSPSDHNGGNNTNTNSGALAVARAPSPILFSGDGGSSPTSPGRAAAVHAAHAVARGGVSMMPSANQFSGIGMESAATSAPTMDIVMALRASVKDGAEEDRSSASNSDVDSESDDFSLDDSASDRSDDSHEPFSAARVMALNRMHQQQRLNRSPGDHLRSPPADSEYQSGDSIDSMVAEDSGGSDSSSSDIAD